MEIDVGPVEHPVEPIEPAAEREREHAEERDGQPEEVQRRRIARPPQPHGAADEQREDADRGEHEVQRAGASRNRRHAHVDHFARAEPQHRVAERAIARASACSDVDDVGDLLHRPIVDGEQQVAAA